MRLRTLLLLTASLAVAVTAGLAAWLSTVDTANRRSSELEQASQDVARTAAALQSLTLEYMQFGGARSVQQWRARFKELEQTLLRAQQLDPASGHLRNMGTQAQALSESFAELTRTTAAEDVDVTTRRHALLLERLLTATESFVDSRRAWAAELGTRTRAVDTKVSAALLGLPLLFIAGLAAGTAVIWLSVLRPLQQVQRTAQRVQAGDTSARCGIAADNEVGDVARAIDRMTDSLLQAQERMQLIMAKSPLGIFIRDMKGQLILANAAWRQIAGQPATASPDVPISQVVHPDDLHIVRAHIDTLMATGDSQHWEVRYRHADGNVVWVRTHLTAMRRDGEWLGVFGIVEDITEHRALLTQLARSNQDLENFAYVASHDLQEPLRMVNSYGQLLQRRFGATLDPKAQAFVAHMVDGGERAQQLIRALLDLARVDSQAQVAPARVSMQQVLDEVLRRQRDLFAAQGARLTQDTLPTVVGDERQLTQLLENLIANALKYRGEAAPVVQVSARHESGAWHFVVRDNGIGIAPQFFDKVFVMFQRLHLRSDRPGTGIGLAICKRVVERHGGRIWVESTPGQGAEFHFTLADLPYPPTRRSRPDAQAALGATAPGPQRSQEA